LVIFWLKGFDLDYSDFVHRQIFGYILNGYPPKISSHMYFLEEKIVMHFPFPSTAGHVSPFLAMRVRERETDIVGEPSVTQTDIRRTDIVGKLS